MVLKLSKYQSLEEFDKAKKAEQKAGSERLRQLELAIKLLIRGGTLKNAGEILRDVNINDDEIRHLREFFIKEEYFTIGSREFWKRLCYLASSLYL